MNTVGRRNFLKMAGLGIAGASLSSLPSLLSLQSLARAADAPTASSRKPNFLLILADDMGFSDPGCYGSEIATPNLDRLAAGGVRFTHCYSTARCWPSRACLLTGYYAQQVRRDAMPGMSGGTGGKRPAWARLLPEMLKPLGYRSYHSGKWHIDGKPADGGFDQVFEYSDTDHHFLSPKTLAGIEPPLQASKSSEGYYASTAIADHAIRYLRDHAEKFADRPFFQYLAFTEPHFPIQALQEDINRYRDRYSQGWDAIRRARWKRMTEMGLINCELSKPDPDIIPNWNLKPEQMKERIGAGEVPKSVPWDTLTDEQKRFQATKMAIHAAMVDRIDREIGRVLDQLKAMNALDNTVIMFASDNGASAEQMIRGDSHDPSAPLGSAKSFVCLGPGWSTSSNTPFRLHKVWVHEGGISSPFIVHWPAGIAARGELRHDAVHFIDVAPTLVQLAGGKWLEQWDGKPVPPAPGKSLAPAFAKDGAVKHEYLWWCHSGNRAIRMGDWKAVSVGADGPWELYDMRTDRCESKNLADKNPEKVKELSERWMSCVEDFKRVAAADGETSQTVKRQARAKRQE
ncbi:MAG: arylsulfatase [Candidatus Sumerlaeota bacterium]|nr:arylsulfatase [Candidatus Sumerlaeota bacterium]